MLIPNKSKLIYNYHRNSKFIYTGSNIQLSPELISMINNYWNDVSNKNKTLFNGDIYSIDKLIAKNDSLEIFVNKTNYAHFLYTLKFPLEKKHKCRAIASNVLMLTNDNYYVLCVMANNTLLPKKIKFIGGSISNDDLVDNIIHPKICVVRETKEEVGVTLTDISIIKTLEPIYYITRENLSFINVLFLAKLKITSDELKKKFVVHKRGIYNIQEEPELDDLFFLKNSNKNIIHFIANNKNILIDYMDELFHVILGDYEAKNILDEI